MIDPKLNSVRALAARHNTSIKRVDAVLRLKGMEEAWKKVLLFRLGLCFTVIDLLCLGGSLGGEHLSQNVRCRARDDDTHTSFAKSKSLWHLTSSQDVIRAFRPHLNLSELFYF